MWNRARVALLSGAGRPTHRAPRAGRPLRLVLATALVAAAGLSSLVVPGPASAEGSRDFYPDSATCGSAGSCRANIEWRTNSYGPAGSTILRRTLFTVFAKQGELLEMGSSAVGVGSGDIVVWNPGQVADDQAASLPAVTSGTNGFRCSDQRAEPGAQAAAGRITSREQEQAGPQSVTGANPTGYVPCHYQVPTDGLYKVAFYGPAGADDATDGHPTGDVDLGQVGDFDSTQGSSVTAWDLTVRADDASTTDITGRVFTYALAAFTGANARPIEQTLYATTLDGYEYKVDTNGLDPNGFVIYGNEQGFLDPEGNPLNHDVLGDGSQMSVVQGGVTLAPPTYPISFTKLSQETLGALGIGAPVRPSLTDLEFDGANTGSKTFVGHGGTFSFDVGAHGTYNLVISRDGTDFDPTKSTNRVLRGVVVAGSHSITWDGNDNAGNPFPAGNGYAVRAEVRGGVYHFPLLDAENSTKGGPSFKLLNPPGGSCPFGTGACTTSFYDDRGYHTSAGDVGTPGQVLTGANPPATDHADVFTGYDSTTDQRAWGSATGGAGSFGDAKGLDSWTYFPSSTVDASLDVLAAPVATDDAGAVQVDHSLSVPADGVLANDAGTSLSVSGHTDPSHGTLIIDPDGSYTYTPTAGFSGQDSFGYTASDPAGQRTSATVQLTVSHLAPDFASTTANTPLQIDKDHGVLVNDLGTGQMSAAPDTEPAHGVLHLNADGSYTYQPDPDSSGDDSFTYTATDGSGNTETATVHLTVLPTAGDDTQSTTAGTSLTVAAPAGVLDNDHGHGLTVTRNTDPGHGSAVVRGDGSYTYKPAAGWSGTDSFEYTVTDADGHSATATVTVQVQPRAYDDTGGTTVGRAVTLHPLANDLGAGLMVRSVSRVSIDAPAFVGPGTAKVRGDSVVYTPARGASGVFRFTYVVQDASGQRARAIDTVTVTPRAVDDSAWTPIDTPVVLDPLAGDLGTRVHLDSVTEPVHGTVVPIGDLLVFAPERGYVGTTEFQYTLRDAAGQLSTAHVSVLVKPSDAKVKPDELSTDPGQAITFDPTVNDPGRASFDHTSLYLGDATGQALVRNLVTPAGTFTVAPRTGKVTFVPAHGFVGRVWNVTYLVTDQAGRLHHSTIMVHIGDLAGGAGRGVASGLKPGRDVVAATGTGTGLRPGRVIKGELASTGNPVGPLLPLAGAALVGLGVLLVRRRPSR